MVQLSKRMKKAQEEIDINKSYSLAEAIDMLASFPKVKFDETVELHFSLNINAKSSDQAVRGTVVLPHGTGKKVRIVVVCKGENVQKAENAGVDLVGGTEVIEKIANGFLDFDCVIATPDMMRDLSKLGKVLGPRGLMPSPKAGTVTQDLERVINEVKAGRVEFKSDKQGGIHVGVGKCSFAKDKLVENANFLIDAMNNAKPSAVKGHLIKTAFLSTTMGPGLSVTL